ncbi:hypothetical protein LTR47_002873 [Exophiala xenobiotica]|nr:hypothetical protein LTR72_003762 [Exophiala xenobiotica]KAK5236147.1 hypothetical protein LTR47_002873 [Exophiala xenobiotica]KAK5255141.1 hypothetical protein LTS06_000554 [Exophiala xenobiotica]KAK5281781.1 hypothetical protein LTR40_004303 [Exophiala xenobiotica]KAK5298679.1 hypothetical protein LTR14_002530 [Exophiala xenobiotica]
MPRKRNHPHTHQEWEAIRPIFTKLYQKEGKPLWEVMKTMAKRGFDAREVHYKHRIKIWGLDRSKKESDMAFAARVIKERQTLDKDTRLRIRGQELTPTDVEKYWKRKPSNVEDTALVPDTPPCMQYWTPAPSPSFTESSGLSPSTTQTRKGKEVDKTSTDFLSHDIQSAISVDDSNFQELARSPSVPPLMIHDAFRSQEKLIFYANEYTRASVDRYSDVRNTDLEIAENNLAIFMNMATQWHQTMNYGQAPYTAALLELKIGNTIPGILRQKPLLLLPTLLGIGLFLQSRARTFELYYQNYRKLLILMKERAEAVLRSASPLATLFESVNELLEHIGPITKIVSDLTQNLCSNRFSDDSSLAFRFHEILAGNALGQENWLDALHHAQKAEDAAIQILGPSNKHHPRVLSTHYHMVIALIGMGDPGQAERMIQKGLSSCNALPNSDTTEYIRSSFLLALAGIRHRQERVVEAKQILRQLLKCRLEKFGPSDTTVIYLVQQLGPTTESLTLLGGP